MVVVCAAQGRLKFIIGQVILSGDHDELLEHVDGQLRWLALVDDACGDRVDDGVDGHLMETVLTSSVAKYCEAAIDGGGVLAAVLAVAASVLSRVKRAAEEAVEGMQLFLRRK